MSLMRGASSGYRALATASTFQITNSQLQISYDGGVLTFAAA